MHNEPIERWIHDHTFGQDRTTGGERRTVIVIGITAVTMVVEIAAGLLFGSMALLADGLHMGSHAVALTITAFAYFYTRRHASDGRFNFGTGKINSLAGFASAVLLVVFAFVMAAESIRRMLSPVAIEFNMAILVALLGLAVNGVSLLVLKGGRRGQKKGDGAHGHHHSFRADHNLWSAYLHVLADALTSLLAVFALIAGKYFGQGWLDPLMGIVGAVLVTRWSWVLIKRSAHVLLDMQAPEALRAEVTEAVERVDGNRVADQHIWSVGPGIYAVELAVVTRNPRPPESYWDLLPRDLGLVHLTVEVHAHTDHSAGKGRADLTATDKEETGKAS